MPLHFLTEQHVAAHVRRLHPLVTVALVERGAGKLTDRFGQYEVQSGDLAIFEPAAEFQYVPARPTRVSMMLTASDLLLDAVAWRHAHHSPAGRARVRATVSALSRPVFVVRPDAIEGRRIRRLLHRGMTLQQRSIDASGHPMFSELLPTMMQVLSALDPVVLRGHPDKRIREQLQAAATFELPKVRHAGVRRALEFLMTAPPQNWTLTALATEAFLSPGHFSRVFTNEVGCSPRRFIAELRLNEFVLLVQSSTLTISQAAHRVGWASTSHAIAAYRHRTGRTPGRVRNGVLGDVGESVFLPGEMRIPPPNIDQRQD